MRRLFTRKEVESIVLDTLTNLGIFINTDEELEFNVPIRFDEALYVKNDEDEQVLVPKPANEDLGKYCKVISTGISWSNIPTGEE